MDTVSGFEVMFPVFEDSVRKPSVGMIFFHTAKEQKLVSK